MRTIIASTSAESAAKDSQLDGMVVRMAKTWAATAAMGETQASVRNTVRRFRQHDEATLAAQYAVKEDEAKFLATSREAAQQLEKLFETDAAKSE